MWWWSSLALAGYGDAQGGLPTWADRDTFFWTNAVRAAPDAFTSQYPCRFDGFQPSEKTPKPLFRIDTGLAAAASFHSHDMHDRGYFDHDSIDGTPWNVRIGQYYHDSGYVGENIAEGYSTPYSAVIEGWMCSSGHRANIMNDAYNELGTGVAGLYYTQDFGRGQTPNRAMGMGVHAPEDPRQQADLYVDLDAPGAPDAVYAVVNGQRVELALALGTEERGVWTASVPAGTGCVEYYFVATGGGGTRLETWPEDGSYGWGDCAWDDAGARWLDEQAPLPPDPGTTTTGDTGTTDPGAATDDTGTDGSTAATVPSADPEPASASAPAGCGCDTSAGPTWLSLAPLLLVRRRRAT